MKAKALLGARVALLILLAVTAWRAPNYRSDYEPGVDSSIFMSMGWHAENGRVLYKDIWEQKPPLTFVLDMAALAIGGDGVNSVRAMERGFALLGIAAFVAAAYLAFGNFWLACAAGFPFLLLLYRLSVFQEGNVTEEYGTILALSGIAFVLASVKTTGRRSLILGGLSGLALSLAVLCKEPFLLVAQPWFLYLVWPRNGDRRAASLRAGMFALGVALPAGAFFVYLVANGAWGAWVDTVAFSFSYAAPIPTMDTHPYLVRLLLKMNTKVEPLLITYVAAALGVLSLTRPSFVRRHSSVPLAIVGSAVIALLAASIGGRYFGHYYLIFVPSFVLLCASGAAFAIDVVSGSRKWSSVALAGALLLLIPSIADIGEFADNLLASARPWSGLWLSRVVRDHTAPDELIWAPWKPLIYVESHRLSPTRRHSVFNEDFIDTPGSTEGQKFAALREDLLARPPRVIVLSPIPGRGESIDQTNVFLERSNLRFWIDANYESATCSPDARFVLLLRKSYPPRPLPSPHTSDAVAMETGLNALYYTGDAHEAVACFRLILAKKPHYGASFQLAKALDAAGDSVAATAQWQQVLRLAAEARDSVTLAEALARLR